MTRIILLDAGPLWLLVQSSGKSRADACREWLRDLRAPGIVVELSDIADFEVRRELIRADATACLRRLDTLRELRRPLAVTPDVFFQAARFWAIVRRAGKPTADPHTLDADCILAAQASLIGQPGDVVTIATTNPLHLNRFPAIGARDWANIAP
jgi:predicted nucleic acid-binding protein